MVLRSGASDDWGRWLSGKHELRKIGSGDYLLPDDGKQVLWRVHR